MMIMAISVAVKAGRGRGTATTLELPIYLRKLLRWCCCSCALKAQGGWLFWAEENWDWRHRLQHTHKAAHTSGIHHKRATEHEQ